MDLAYLEWLQSIRMSMPPIFEQFFLFVSGVMGSPALLAFICIPYWCFDKRLGITLLFNMSISSFADNFAKVIACVYRPWVRSANIHPSRGALKGASGYSFPSGHSQMAASIFGSFAHYFKKVWVTVLCTVLIFLTALSRNILGVHTPQDVIIGVLIGIGTIYLVDPLLRWAEAKEGHDLILLLATIGICVITTIIVLVKPYPKDYDVAGTLLVNPIAMQADYFKTVGLLVGAVTGWFLERRFLNFTIPMKRSLKVMALRILICSAIIGAFFAFTYLAFQFFNANNNVRRFLEYSLLAIGGAYLGPLAFTKAEERLRWKD